MKERIIYENENIQIRAFELSHEERARLSTDGSTFGSIHSFPPMATKQIATWLKVVGFLCYALIMLSAAYGVLRFVQDFVRH